MAKEGVTSRDALLRQQTSLAKFGVLALRSDDLTEILQEACHLVCAALRTDFSKVMELVDDGSRLLVRAGTGWRPGIVGEKVLTLEEDEATTHALQSSQPLVISDVEKAGLTIADFLKEHGVRSLVNVNILGEPGARSFGILEVDSCEPREFTDNDIDFLHTYANIIAAAVERVRIVATLRQRAKEKEQLLQELQHRTKNNLQVISSLVRLQAQRVTLPQARDELQKITTRIESLRLLHDKLYTAGEVDRIDMGSYLVDFAGTVLRFHGELSARIRLVSEIERVMVPTQTAVPLGLITNEFVTNSLKYAFDGQAGRIGIQVERPPGGATLVRLWDDGKGMPEAHGNGTGMFLIENLARQIASEVTWQTEGGTTLRLVLRP